MADPYKNKVEYEWGNEWIDHETENIENCDFSYTLKYRDLPYEDDEGIMELVLVYNLVNDCDVEERSWAYVKDGKLPETFCNGRKVPKRFHKELAERIEKEVKFKSDALIRAKKMAEKQLSELSRIDGGGNINETDLS